MRIAILTCNIGGIDEILPPPKQKTDHERYEFFYYTENTLPFPLPNMDNRMKGKYFKTQAHKFLDHDIFIWLDGCIEIKDGTFNIMVENALRGYDLVNSLHFDRPNVYKEIEFIQEWIKKGHPYLISRYAFQPFDKEIEFYRKEKMPESYPLFNCWFFARWNNEKVNKIFDQWWDMILRYSNFDQSQFSYVAWKYGLTINSIKNINHYLERKQHK